MPDDALYDVIVVGAGAGGMAAAVVCANEGLSVLLLEKGAQVGGTTAISGGMVWVPGNGRMCAAGLPDTIKNAELYLRHVLPPQLRPALVDAFLEYGKEAVRYLEARANIRFRPVRTYPDYLQQEPGATLGGRVLEPVPFDARKLGRRFAQLRPPLPEFMLFGGMMVDRADIPHFRRAGRSLGSTLRVGRLVALYLLQRLTAERGTTLYLGNALAARLLRAVVDKGVDLRTDAAVDRLLIEGDRVSGVAATIAGASHTFSAARAVVLACGGFSHDRSRRADLLPEPASRFSAACPTNTGDGLFMAEACGADLRAGADQNAFWTPVSLFHRKNGEQAVFPHILTDRGKPGFIAVNGAGRRFTNEALSYHDFGKAMLRPGNTPAYLICDSAALRRYGLGAIKPFAARVVVKRHCANGDIRVGKTVADLAAAISVSVTALVTTISDYNRDAVEGVDRRFGRGGDAYQRHVGDPDRKPNPCVAPLAEGPFYAVELQPADLGTAAGLATDARGQVLRRDGSPVAGLFACGNDMCSVMEGAYPGPGITLGPALTFAYLAALAIAAPAG
jgi:succinate dehydrogenase/fumarate reductase flavoprotein subunit